MRIEVLKCRNCGTVFTVDLKRLWFKNSCVHCESKDIEIYNFDEEHIEEEINNNDSLS